MEQNKAVDKTLALQCEKRDFTDQNTKQTRSYNVYFVVVAGLKIPVQPSDKTAKAIIDQYFKD